jgi:hypothetical protein
VGKEEEEAHLVKPISLALRILDLPVSDVFMTSSVLQPHAYDGGDSDVVATGFGVEVDL